MKKERKNISAKTGIKNKAAVLLCTIMLTVSFGALTGCSASQDAAEDAAGQEVAETSKTEDIQTEESQADEPASASDSDASETDKASAEAESSASEAKQQADDSSVFMEDLTFSLYESKQEITDKLTESGLPYNEHDSAAKYADSEYNQYDSYYMVGESPEGTDVSQWVDASLCIYFKDDQCVRLTLLDDKPETARGVREGDSYDCMAKQYGDSYEEHIYAAHGVYHVYLYSFADVTCEFTILEDYPLGNIDIYVPELYPVYEYGEELEK